MVVGTVVVVAILKSLTVESNFENNKLELDCELLRVTNYSGFYISMVNIVKINY